MFYRTLPIHLHQQPVFANDYYDAFDAYDTERIMAERQHLARIQAQRREQERQAYIRRQLERQAALERQSAYEEALQRQYYAEQQRRAAALQNAQRDAIGRRRAAACQAEPCYYHSRVPARQPFFVVDTSYDNDDQDFDSTAEASHVPVAAPPRTESKSVKINVDAGAARSPSPVHEQHDSSTVDEAARVLQRHFKAHLARKDALTKLASLTQAFESERASFTRPELLSFLPSPPASNTSAAAAADNDDHASVSSSDSTLSHKLAYTPTNRPVLAYEEFLVGTLSKIDAVESHGDKVVKQARKELVRSIEAELAKLDEFKEQAWREASAQLQQPHEPSPVSAAQQDSPVEVQVDDAVIEDVPSLFRDEPSSSFREDDHEQGDAVDESAQDAREVKAPTSSSETVHFEELSVDSSSSTSASNIDSEDEVHDQALNDILDAARELGERVERMEEAERDTEPVRIEITTPNDDHSDKGEDFVVV